MTAIKKPLLLFILLALIGCIVAGTWFTQQRSPEHDNNSNVPTQNLASPSSPLLQQSAPLSLDLPAEVRQKIDTKKTSKTPFPFDIEYVFNVLSEVRVDRDGNLVLDDKTLETLKKAVAKITIDIGDAELIEIRELITLGLPGEAGVEAGKIFTDYYQYRSAEKDFLDTAGSTDIDGINTNFEQVVALRHAHLGYDVAESLYGKEQGASLFMINAMKIQDNPNLTDEEKEHQQLILSQALEAQLSNDKHQDDTETMQWMMRFKNFDQERQYVLDAALSQAEKNKQIDDLFEQHFAPNEIDKARNFHLP